MRVVIFGASGMIGQGALRACLLDPQVDSVLLVVRTPLNVNHPKVRQVVHTDFTDFTAVRGEFEDLDACFYCAGVSSAGRSEEEYFRITHDHTLAAAAAVSAANPSLTFTFVSGEGASESSRSAWAVVLGHTENALLRMPFPTYVFRPFYVRPLHGAVPRTPSHRLMYRLTSWLYPLLHRLAPSHTTTTDHLGRAMIAVVHLRGGAPAVLHSPDINRLGAVVGGAVPGGENR
ncbi:NAD-dependent epimerase/dehydratase family protein [Streptomyces niveiscabiei]|uniref:NAD-dependent epimerase/dehydratase family protein n=1 Tax=Streptomyces niveiscabiei TaxID=164115 RepID=UPI0029A1FBAF|nr:NAD-dependent epimerase/dehydratase family protein [Streptomyces niveiscabiei]MDX3386101.1 NAD-dependent epimerase/dehydratase family protein [Streptomyces niveiscabiei]